MKFKVFLAQFFILFICVKLNAQIENEIKSFTDSTEVIVNNGRKMIVRSIINNENVKSIEIYNYLQNTVMGKGYAAFYYSEELNINLLLSNWAEWVNKAKQYNKYSNAFCHPNAYPISPIIFDELRKKNDSIVDLLENSSLNNEDKLIIKIYLHYLKIGRPDDLYSKMLAEFNKEYPITSYADFLKLYMPHKTTKTSLAFSAGTRALFLTENLNEQFNPEFGFFMSFNLNINRVFSSLYFTGGNLYLNPPFSTYNGTDTLNFNKNERFSSFQGGVYLGYFLVRSNRFHIAPYLNLSGGYLESTKFNSNNNNDDDGDIKIYSSFIYGAGIHTEVKIWEFKSKNQSPYYYWGYEAFNNHISLKLDSGFDFIANSDNKYKGNIGYFNLGLVWGVWYLLVH